MKKLLLILLVLCNVASYSQISDLPPSCDGTFNLGVKRAEILGPNTTYYGETIQYFQTLVDATNWTNPISNINHYVSTALPQIIYAKYISPNDGATHIDNFNLVSGPTSSLATSIYTGGNTLNAIALGAGPYSYQWYTENMTVINWYQDSANYSYYSPNFPGNFYFGVKNQECNCVAYSSSIDVYPPVPTPDNLLILPVNGEIVGSESILFNDFQNNYPMWTMIYGYDLPAGFALDYNSGVVYVLPGTAPGNYNFMYSLISEGNPYNQNLNYNSIPAPVNITIPSEGLVLNSFLDTNNNGTKDINESVFKLGKYNYELNNDGTVHDISTSTGLYTIYESNPTNSYDFGLAVDPIYSPYYTVTPSSYTDVSVVADGGAQVYNFPVTITQNYNDLATYVFSFNRPRPGFSYTNVVMYRNDGSQTIASGTVTFTKDNVLSIASISQSGTLATANGFTYDFTNLLPGETRYIYVTMNVPTIPTVALGDLVANSVSITLVAGDIIPSNNNYVNTQAIVGSYDPNDKVEAHGGKIQQSTFTANDYLTYTIQFENTGSAEAENVRVEDILDAKLDETTVRMIDASHNYTLNRVGNSLKWNFENIDLPPSIANTTTGKGYISFQVKPKAGYAVGDIIPNKANIYFDFNPAIVTNTFDTEFVSFLGVAEFEKAGFKVYPNPTAGLVTIALKESADIIDAVVVCDVSGKIVLTKKINNVTATIDLSNLTKGFYFVKVQSEGLEKVMKVVKQ